MPDDGPYVPSWNYPDNSPKMCPCGHHEGYHNDARACLLAHSCSCSGLPDECFTTDEEFRAASRRMEAEAAKVRKDDARRARLIREARES